MSLSRGPYLYNGKKYLLSTWSAQAQYQTRAIWLQHFGRTDVGYCSAAMIVVPVDNHYGYWALVQAPGGQIIDWRWYHRVKPAQKWAEKTLLGWIQAESVVITGYFDGNR